MITKPTTTTKDTATDFIGSTVVPPADVAHIAVQTDIISETSTTKIFNNNILKHYITQFSLAHDIITLKTNMVDKNWRCKFMPVCPVSSGFVTKLFTGN